MSLDWVVPGQGIQHVVQYHLKYAIKLLKTINDYCLFIYIKTNITVTYTVTYLYCYHMGSDPDQIEIKVLKVFKDNTKSLLKINIWNSKQQKI